MTERKLSFGSPVGIAGGFNRWVENALRQIERWSHAGLDPFDSRDTVTFITVNGSTLPDHGMVVLDTTGGTAHVLPPPRLGTQLTIYARLASTDDVVVALASTEHTINGSSLNGLNFDSTSECITLRGISNTAWLISSNEGGVTLVASS